MRKKAFGHQNFKFQIYDYKTKNLLISSSPFLLVSPSFFLLFSFIRLDEFLHRIRLADDNQQITFFDNRIADRMKK